MVYTAACQVKGGVLVQWFTLRHVRLKVGSWCVAYTVAGQVKVLKVGSWCLVYTAACQVKV